jgi:hypothetical protein
MYEIIKNIFPTKLSWFLALGTLSLTGLLLSDSSLSSKLVVYFGNANDIVWLIAPIITIALGTLITLLSVLSFIHSKPALPTNYERKQIARGIFAYVPTGTSAVESGTHKLCASCYENGETSTLNQTREPKRMIGLICSKGCPKLVFTHYESP